MERHAHESRLVALGANVAGLADAAVGMGAAMFVGSVETARRLTGGMWAPAWQNHGSCGCSCGCHTIRHHYCCACPPPCCGCHG